MDQTLYVVGPPDVHLRPGHVLLFELFLLCGQASTQDRVVAWGALPLTTPDFHLIQGKYKLPLLRGEVDPTIDKYSVRYNVLSF